jgi:hypothetical protein
LETHIVNYLCQFFQALQTMKCQHKNWNSVYTKLHRDKTHKHQKGRT